MFLFRKAVFLLVGASLSTLPSVLQAQTITWTDDDFNKIDDRPGYKSYTVIQGQDVIINTTNTAKFLPHYDQSFIGALTLTANSTLTAESNVYTEAGGPQGSALLLIGNSEATFKGDLTAVNYNNYGVGSRDLGIDNQGGSELYVNGKSYVAGINGLYTHENSTSSFNGHLELRANTKGIVAETGSVNLKDTDIFLGPATEYPGIAQALVASNSGQINVDGTLNINSTVYYFYDHYDGVVYGVVSQDQSTVNLKDTYITFSADPFWGGGDIGLFSKNQSQINIDGDLTLINSNPYSDNPYAIYM